MLEAHHQPNLTQPLVAATKRVVPWIVLGVLLFYMGSTYAKYRTNMTEWEAAQKTPAAATKAAQTAQAQKTTKKPLAKPFAVVVLSDVTFRSDADFSADAIRDLKKGEKLAFVAQAGDWYKVKDAGGTVGFVTSAARYTKVLSR